LKSSHWYWQGYCHKRNDFRLFKLSRTSNLQIQEEFFTPRDYQKPQLDFTDILATMQTKIKIRLCQVIVGNSTNIFRYDIYLIFLFAK